MDGSFTPTATYEAEMRASLLTSAQTGYAFLDNLDPDWRDHIDADLLDMEHDKSCGLAQYGNRPFHEMARQLRLTGDDVIRYGFFCPKTENPGEQSWQYRLLTEIWQDLLAGEHTPESVPDYRLERHLEDA